jgi:hypothetical protein
MNRLSRPACRLALLCSVVAAVAVAYLLRLAADDYEATRVRNALIAHAAGSEAFDWVPPAWPAAFRRERGPTPAVFTQAVQPMAARGEIGDGWTLARRLAAHLGSAGGDGTGLKTDTRSAYRSILAGEGGYCADYTQVFNGLAHAAQLDVREWGMSFDGYSGEGHAFSEVFASDLGQWVFVDSFYGFWVRDAATATPLSALAFRERLSAARGEERVDVMPLAADGHAFTSDRKLLDYYRRGADQFFLYMANDVFAYDHHPVVRHLRAFPSSLEQLVSIVLGAHPRILLLQTSTNAAAIESLGALRMKVLFAASTGCLLGLAAAASGLLCIGGKGEQ